MKDMERAIGLLFVLTIVDRKSIGPAVDDMRFTALVHHIINTYHRLVTRVVKDTVFISLGMIQRGRRRGTLRPVAMASRSLGSLLLFKDRVTNGGRPRGNVLRRMIDFSRTTALEKAESATTWPERKRNMAKNMDIP